MSKISVSEIEKVARLARIELGTEELETMTLEISSILNFVETLQAIDTKNVQATSQVTGLNDVWREDKVVKSKVPAKDLLAGAPETKDGYIKVKKVL
ncbi:MAG: Asp-tRNA(Asn)/Glu-tRNA(Gln) amidotransferase subunit GatC [Chryseobacterium sp.]|nr:MAG: Asp-tRNA(Asn)/Glu-tRNA(Gln) amidotransferase subunit GatC [Chryseobacterium sp.]